MDDLNRLFLKKVQEVIDFAQDPKNDRKAIVVKLVRLRNWVWSDRSLLEHQMLQSFFTYLYETYGDDYVNRDDFVDYIKYEVGHCEVKQTVAKVKGEKVMLRKYKIKSLSFWDCTQRGHHKVVEKVSEFVLHKWGIVLDDWKKNNKLHR